MIRPLTRSIHVMIFLALWAPSALAESHLMRFADVHGDRVVFTYEGDLWMASTEGGDARRITNDPGLERFAKFSPDGRLLAFTANYDGDTDIYVMDARGGEPTRLTYHPAADHVLDWFPDGQSVLFRSRRTYPFRADKIYRVSIKGGLPEPLPVDRAGLTSLSPDGQQVAYNRISREFRTWKRHKGGTAQDIWVGSLELGDFQKITDWHGTDNYPMWATDAVYYTSDREHGTLNIYKHDLTTKQITPMTSYRDYDVKYPSLGQDKIVYQYAESLHLLDLKAGEFREIAIHIPSDLVKMRPEYLRGTGHLGSFSLSPAGMRMLLETRGEIVNVPVDKGEPINLTASSASREKNAAWSPDGRWIAFISDKTGEEELYLVDEKGEKPWRQLTRGGLGYRMQPVWSRNSEWLAFADKFMKLNLVNAASGEITVIDQGEYDDGWERWGIQDYVWSPDSRWIAYAKLEENLHQSIFLYSLKDQKRHRVTSDHWNDFSPSFDETGSYLYLLSNRTYKPTMGSVDQNHIFLDVCRPYVIVLREGELSPFAPPENPVEGENGETETDNKEETSDNAETKIDTSDFERRTIAVPNVSAGNYFRLECTTGGFFYLKKTRRQFLKYQAVNDRTGGKLDLYYYEIDEDAPDESESKRILSGINNYHQAADNESLVYRSGKTYGVLDSGAMFKAAEVGDGEIDLNTVTIKVDRKQEFLQIFNEAWRVQRDWFYDPGMHGVDWNAAGEKYRKFIPNCGNRSDLNYLIGEMIGELDAGHTYVFGGDIDDDNKNVATGLLGVDFETPPSTEYHRIADIIPGHNWDPAERSPLRAPGCPIKTGDYLIAVDGKEIKSTDNPYRFLENKSNRVVQLTYNTNPTSAGAKTYRVKTIGSERAIRYRQWVEKNRQYVEKAGNGQIGYVHLPDMMEAGLIEFGKAFYPVHAKPAMIIDVRYNGGGFVADMIIDRLERKLWALTQPREGKFIRDPERVFHGHLIVVMNEHTGSNGEYFGEAIKIKGLAELIGMRTWGGAIGIEPHQRLIDGGTTTPPQFAPYGLNGRWLIEGHGVVPDIEIQNMPGDVVKGRDAQLETAISNLLSKLAKDPMTIPERPAYPKKTKPVKN